jgi:hypothetical protein
MDYSFKEIIRGQFEAAVDMLKNAILEYPEEL